MKSDVQSSPSDTPPSIILVGPHNSGKTTLFNGLTGSRYKTVNYPGSTVSYHKGKLIPALGSPTETATNACGSVSACGSVIVDTPGIQSLTACSLDQEVTYRFLFEKEVSKDVVVVVVDGTQLGRHLFLAEQIKECGFAIVLCVTMEDMLIEDGKCLNTEELSKQMKLPSVILDARKKGQLSRLISKVREVEKGMQPRRIQSPISPEEIPSRHQKTEAIEKQVLPGGFSGRKKQFHTDRLLLHPVWGFLIFLLIMFSTFSMIFWLAAPFMDQIDSAFGGIIAIAHTTLPASWMTDLFFDGLVAGIGSVMIFLPQIVILFLIMGLLEDTGYLARGALLVDKPLSLIGLNGRSFVPLLSGFACAIPAILASRTISSRWERIATIFIIPLMSCSARLPVYSLLLAFLLPREKPWMGGLALSGLYFLGLVWGSVFATILSKLPSFKKRQSVFLLELPAYRRPIFRVVWTSTLHSAMYYLKKAGPNIVLLSIGLWLLTHLPLTPSKQGQNSEYASVAHSYAGTLGHALKPVMDPMGLDWRSGVALIMGFAAREVFVSSMALLYRVDTVDSSPSDDAVQSGLLKRMKDITFENSSNKIFTVSSVLGLLFFFTVALQCIPTVITAKSEIGSWKIPLIQWVAFSGTAYIGAVILVQSLRFLGVS